MATLEWEFFENIDESPGGPAEHQCPKCRRWSGDDWRQCNDKCPMIMSPHYDKETEDAFRQNEKDVQS